MRAEWAEASASAPRDFYSTAPLHASISVLSAATLPRNVLLGLHSLLKPCQLPLS